MYILLTDEKYNTETHGCVLFYIVVYYYICVLFYIVVYYFILLIVAEYAIY